MLREDVEEVLLKARVLRRVDLLGTVGHLFRIESGLLHRGHELLAELLPIGGAAHVDDMLALRDLDVPRLIRLLDHPEHPEHAAHVHRLANAELPERLGSPHALDRLADGVSCALNLSEDVVGFGLRNRALAVAAAREEVEHAHT